MIVNKIENFFIILKIFNFLNFTCVFVSLPGKKYEFYLFFDFVYPAGEPMIPHLPRYQGVAVVHYGCVPDALNMRHPQLSLNWGMLN
jgi:hypothetical protein